MYLCALMKRIAVIFLFALYLISATEAKQLLKFPVLFEHYAEHKQHNKNISFFDFIYMHYAGSDFDDGDQDRDRQLPFKSSTFAVSDMASFVPASSSVSLKPAVSTKDQAFFTEDLHFKSSYLTSIWQPPKVS